MVGCEFDACFRCPNPIPNFGLIGISNNVVSGVMAVATWRNTMLRPQLKKKNIVARVKGMDGDAKILKFGGVFFILALFFP